LPTSVNVRAVIRTFQDIARECNRSAQGFKPDLNGSFWMRTFQLPCCLQDSMEHSLWSIMKTLRLILLGAVLAELIPLPAATAQIYSPRRITQRIAPQLNQGQTNPTAVKTAPAPPGTVANPATAPAVTGRALPTRPAVRIVQPPPPDPEKVRAAKEAAVRRTVEFQKKRASEGSQSAQYELGVRYLKGDGVEKDEAAGRKWLESSAKTGYSPAIKKLQELDKAADPAKLPSPSAAAPRPE
jgi:hypothetical protein